MNEGIYKLSDTLCNLFESYVAFSYIKMVVLKLNNSVLGREGMEFQSIYLSHNDKEKPK